MPEQRVERDDAMDPGPYTATRCPCGHKGCRAWLVEPVAAVQGVCFNEFQAVAVARLLNNLVANSQKAKGG